MTSTSDFSACPASEAILTTNKMTMRRENISRSTEISFNMIYPNNMFFFLIFLVISGGGGVNDQLGQFLTDNGLGHLKESFVEQEVEVRQLVGMSDQNLMELGVRTIGARMRIRSAATNWVPREVNGTYHMYFK